MEFSPDQVINMSELELHQALVNNYYEVLKLNTPPTDLYNKKVHYELFFDLIKELGLTNNFNENIKNVIYAHFKNIDFDNLNKMDEIFSSDTPILYEAFLLTFLNAQLKGTNHVSYANQKHGSIR